MAEMERKKFLRVLMHLLNKEDRNKCFDEGRKREKRFTCFGISGAGLPPF